MKLWITDRNMAEMLLLYQGAEPEGWHRPQNDHKEMQNNKEIQRTIKRHKTTTKRGNNYKIFFLFCVSESGCLWVGWAFTCVQSHNLTIAVGYMEFQRVAIIISF